MNFEEQLSKYLSGEMTPDEMAAFEKAWSEHPERDELVRRHPDLDRVFEQLVEEDVAAQLRAFQNEKDDEPKVEEKETPAGKPLRWLWVELAAAILFGAALMWFYMPKSSAVEPNLNMLAEVAAEFYDPYPAIGLRGGDTEIDEGFAAYRNEDWKQAIEHFWKIEKDDSKYIEARFFSGIASIELEDPMFAVSVLTEVEKSKDVRYAEPAEWYKALALFQIPGNREGIEVLENIVLFKEEHTYHKEATELLQKLK